MRMRMNLRIAPNYEHDILPVRSANAGFIGNETRFMHLSDRI